LGQKMNHDLNVALPYLRDYQRTRNHIPLYVGSDHMEELDDPRHIFLRRAAQMAEAGFSHIYRNTIATSEGLGILHGFMSSSVHHLSRPDGYGKYMIYHSLNIHDHQDSTLHCLEVPLKSHEIEAMHAFSKFTDTEIWIYQRRQSLVTRRNHTHRLVNASQDLLNNIGPRSIHPRHDEINNLEIFGIK